MCVDGLAPLALFYRPLLLVRTTIGVSGNYGLRRSTAVEPQGPAADGGGSRVGLVVSHQFAGPGRFRPLVRPDGTAPHQVLY